jgi:hypothetical protein
MSAKKTTKTTAKTAKAKKADDAAPTPGAAAAAEPTAKKLSALDAAAEVLAEAGTAMTCMEMITAMADRGYWASPGGKTPSATLYSAILRELQTKGEKARFRKTERGKFARAGTA